MAAIPAVPAKWYHGGLKAHTFGEFFLLEMETTYPSKVTRTQSLQLSVSDATDLLKELKKFCIEARQGTMEDELAKRRRG